MRARDENWKEKKRKEREEERKMVDLVIGGNLKLARKAGPAFNSAQTTLIHVWTQHASYSTLEFLPG